MSATIATSPLNRRASSVSSPAGQVRRLPPLPAAEPGKVRLGGQGPIFRKPAIADAGRVRLGGQGPIFR